MITIINHLIHIVAGYFFSYLFPFSWVGALKAFGFSAVTQLIDMFKFKREHDSIVNAMEMNNPADPHVEEWRNKNIETYGVLIQLYILKVIWYGGVIIVSAYVAS